MNQKTNLQFFLPGTVPPKKNSKILNARTKKIFPSNRHRKWHTMAKMFVPKKLRGALLKNIELTMFFVVPDNKIRDLNNMQESVLDLLVDAKVILDDRWQYLPSITIKIKGICKESPGVLVVINEIDEVLQYVDPQDLPQLPPD